MPVSKAIRTLLLLTLLISLAPAGRAVAACHGCDPFLHCINSYPGAMVCLEGPGTCGLAIPCGFGGGGPIFEDGGDNLTTWTLFDASASTRAMHPSRRAGAPALALGEDARAGSPVTMGVLADATLAHGREFAISLVDAAGDGFGLRRTVEGTRVRLDVREVRGEVAGAVLASESLAEHEQLSVQVRVDGRERVLVLQTSSVRGAASMLELSRLRRTLLVAGRTIPPRREPLLRVRAQ